MYTQTNQSARHEIILSTHTRQLSVIVKCYNEAAKLDLCLRALRAATASLDTEIILVDSMSTDSSLDIAMTYPIRIVQLADSADQRCGAVAQLGYQCSSGSFLLLIDGDMELLPDFLPAALALLDQDQTLAGVGGRLIELSDGMEFRERQLRREKSARPGNVELITGCGLYRAEAIRELGYFMDRNLHCFEEFELGLRLRAHGWRMQLLDLGCVRHHGHRDPPIHLLVRRWKTRFLYGYGELLRGTWQQSYFPQAARKAAIPLFVVGWWMVLIALALATLFDRKVGVTLVIVAILPLVALLVRKASVARAAHSFSVWQFSAASMIAGLCAAKIEPTLAIPARFIKSDVPVSQDTRELQKPEADHDAIWHRWLCSGAGMPP